MAEAKDLDVKVNIRFDTSYPKAPSTIEERTQALKDAKGLLTTTSNGGVFGAITGVSQGAVAQNNDGTLALMRLAEYMVVGHDYLDTHPVQEQKGPSKKERRRAVKEMRKMVQTEVEEEFDRRHRETNEAPEDKPVGWWNPTPEEKADEAARTMPPFGEDENNA